MNIAIVFASRVSCRCYSLFLSFSEHNHLSYFFGINKLTLLNPDIFHMNKHWKLFIVSMDSTSTALNSSWKLYSDSTLPTLENPLAFYDSANINTSFHNLGRDGIVTSSFYEVIESMMQKLSVLQCSFTATPVVHRYTQILHNDVLLKPSLGFRFFPRDSVPFCTCFTGPQLSTCLSAPLNYNLTHSFIKQIFNFNLHYIPTLNTGPSTDGSS